MFVIKKHGQLLLCFIINYLTWIEILYYSINIKWIHIKMFIIILKLFQNFICV